MYYAVLFCTGWSSNWLPIYSARSRSNELDLVTESFTGRFYSPATKGSLWSVGVRAMSCISLVWFQRQVGDKGEWLALCIHNEPHVGELAMGMRNSD